MDRGAWWAAVHGVMKSLATTEAAEHMHTHKYHTCFSVSLSTLIGFSN